jgi:NTE family protein
VGALNGTYLAGGLGNIEAPNKLSAMWRNMVIDRIYRFVALDLLRSPLRLFSKRISDSAALLDPAPLYDWVRSEFPWRGLRETIQRPDFHALVLTATDMTAGNSVNFVDSWHHKGPLLPGGLHLPDPSLQIVHTSLRVEHCLASCAIPFLFPPINVDGRMMIDGSVRQNTPLSPALRMGATRILVVGVKRPHGQRVKQHQTAEDTEMGFAQLAGKTLNAMMLDPIERDLQLVELFNEILSYGEESYGPQFITGLNETVGKKHQTSFRRIQTLEIRPSLDLGAVAAEVFQESNIEASRPTRMLLQAIGNRESPSEADLLSYLLFDKSYTSLIEQLGFEDARYRQEEIARFLRLGQPAT